ncbi:MAG: hypothetical protein EOO48_01620 [Flavobacterium sp.]|nr:MAG: hypothetical protein EOO48_01620 [Flavobacterium sp.]
MKAIRLLFLFLAVSAVTLYSCSDSSPIENNSTTTKSIPLRTALNEIKKANNITGRSVNENPFCFSFVYPITLSLSNGTNVSVTSFDGLVDLLTNESTNLYIDGISYPFQVMMQGAVSTIGYDEEFVALLVNCGFNTWNNDLSTTYCFDIVFPVSVTTPNGTYDIHTVEEFNVYLNAPASGQAQINYPVSVLYNGQVVVINNIYEFYDMINNCNSCTCSQEWAPVCVQTTVGTIQYGNFCFAQCAGFSQNDLVSCDPTSICDIFDIAVTPGACNTDGTYALTINFQHADNPSSSEFSVIHGNTVVGTYPISQLPVTISHFPNNGQSADFLSIAIAGGSDCTPTQQWAVPNCSQTCESSCPTTFDPVCVQTTLGIQQFSNSCLALCAGFSTTDFIDCGVNPTNFGTALGSCFNLVYPVQIMGGGQVITATNNGTVLQYWVPSQAPIPNFVYPVTIIQANNPVTVQNQSEFLSIVNNCN